MLLVYDVESDKSRGEFFIQMGLVESGGDVDNEVWLFFVLLKAVNGHENHDGSRVIGFLCGCEACFVNTRVETG